MMMLTTTGHASYRQAAAALFLLAIMSTGGNNNSIFWQGVQAQPLSSSRFVSNDAALAIPVNLGANGTEGQRPLSVEAVGVKPVQVDFYTSFAGEGSGSTDAGKVLLEKQGRANMLSFVKALTVRFSQQGQLFLNFAPRFVMVEGKEAQVGCRTVDNEVIPSLDYTTTSTDAPLSKAELAKKERCEDHCLNDGRYCGLGVFNDEAHDQLKGHHAVEEMARRKCLWKLYSSKTDIAGVPSLNTFFAYQEAMTATGCGSSASNPLKHACIEQALESVGVTSLQDYAAIKHCMESTASLTRTNPKQNDLLQEELDFVNEMTNSTDPDDAVPSFLLDNVIHRTHGSPSTSMSMLPILVIDHTHVFQNDELKESSTSDNNNNAPATTFPKSNSKYLDAVCNTFPEDQTPHVCNFCTNFCQGKIFENLSNEDTNTCLWELTCPDGSTLDDYFQTIGTSTEQVVKDMENAQQQEEVTGQQQSSSVFSFAPEILGYGALIVIALCIFLFSVLVVYPVMRRRCQKKERMWTTEDGFYTANDKLGSGRRRESRLTFLSEGLKKINAIKAPSLRDHGLTEWRNKQGADGSYSAGNSTADNSASPNASFRCDVSVNTADRKAIQNAQNNADLFDLDLEPELQYSNILVAASMANDLEEERSVRAAKSMKSKFLKANFLRRKAPEEKPNQMPGTRHEREREEMINFTYC